MRLKAFANALHFGPVFTFLIGGLLLAVIAWGIAEIYGEQAKTAA